MANVPGRPILLIGLGNTLRRDDAAGRLTVESYDNPTALPGLRTISVHQLVPELAAHLACASAAIFVDASADPGATDVCLSRLDATGPGTCVDGHSLYPAGLLELTELVFARRPEAWLITIPARDFGLGEGLSPAARRGVGRALRVIDELIESLGREPGEGPGVSIGRVSGPHPSLSTHPEEPPP